MCDSKVPVIFKCSIRLKVAIWMPLRSASSDSVIFCASLNCRIRLPINIIQPPFGPLRLQITKYKQIQNTNYKIQNTSYKIQTTRNKLQITLLRKFINDRCQDIPEFQ